LVEKARHFAPVTSLIGKIVSKMICNVLKLNRTQLSYKIVTGSCRSGKIVIP